MEREDEEGRWVLGPQGAVSPTLTVSRNSATSSERFSSCWESGYLCTCRVRAEQ